MSEQDVSRARLRPRQWIPIVGTLLGATAGFAFYWFYGCDSG